MNLTLGFSPCPNDTFIFDAMVNSKIDTEGLSFEVTLADVEELNNKAFKNELNVTKLSYHAFAYLLQTYNLLSAGSALGNNCGPLLISSREINKDNFSKLSIAIPGKYTTANFLLNYFLPTENKEEILFSEIENEVLSGKIDAGVIIHENRFTYHERGLHLIQDLGEYWETNTKFAIPLGGIVVQNTLNQEIQEKFNRVLKRSINYAFEHSKENLPEFVTCNAQEMSQEVMKKHINLYVNDYTKDLGVKGREAIRFLIASIGVTKELVIVD